MNFLNKWCYSSCVLLFFLVGPVSTVYCQQLPARDFIFLLDKNAFNPDDSLFMQSISTRKPIDQHFSVMDFEFHIFKTDHETINLVFNESSSLTTLAYGSLNGGNPARINIGAYHEDPVEFNPRLCIPPEALTEQNYCLFQFLYTNRSQLFKKESPPGLFVVHAGITASNYQNRLLKEQLGKNNIIIRSRYLCLFIHPDDLMTFAEKYNIDHIARYNPDLQELGWINLKETLREFLEWLRPQSVSQSGFHESIEEDLSDESQHENSNIDIGSTKPSDTLPDAQQRIDALISNEAELEVRGITDSSVANETPIVEEQIQETETIHEADSLQENDGVISEAETFIELSHPYFTFTGSVYDGLEINYKLDFRNSLKDKTGMIKNGIFVPDIEREYKSALRLSQNLTLQMAKPEGYNIKKQDKPPTVEQLHEPDLSFFWNKDNAFEKVLPLEIWPWNYFNILYLSLHEVKQRNEIRDTLEKMLADFIKNKESFLIYLSNGGQPITADNPDDYDRRVYMALHTLRPGLPNRNIDISNLKQYITENDIFLKHKGIRVWYFTSERIDNLFMREIFDERFMRDFSTNERQVLPIIYPFVLKD